MRPRTITGNTVSRYTRSPSAACFVLMLLIMLSGILVPVPTIAAQQRQAARIAEELVQTGSLPS